MKTLTKLFKNKRLLLLGVVSLVWQSCSCCLYLNHVYNTRKYYEKAEYSKLERTEKVPNDSLWVSSEEKESWDKVIKTGSLALDRWPEDKQYKAEILWRMGDAYFFSKKWEPALTKYSEYERYFESHEALPRVQFQRIRTMVKMDEYNLAQNSAEEILLNQPEHKFAIQIEELLALCYQKTNNEGSAIKTLLGIIANPNADSLTLANAHYKLGALYFNQDEFKSALEQFNQPALSYLPPIKVYPLALYKIKTLKQLKNETTLLSYVDSLIALEQLQPHLWTLNLYKGQSLLDTPEYLKGDKLLDSLSIAKRKSDSSAYAQWIVAIHKDTVRQDIDGAIESYTKSQDLRPYSTWGKLSKEKLLALRKFSKLKSSKDLNTKERFQFAEIWFTERNQADSALANIELLINDSSVDSLSRLKATYTKAYLMESAKEDTASANEIYRSILRDYPNTNYALQSEKNLGLPQSIYSLEDLSNNEFNEAESLYYSLDSIALIDPALYDSLSLIALNQFDSLANKWETTKTAPKSLYLKAWILENERGNKEAAKSVYQEVGIKFPNTKWATSANQKLVVDTKDIKDSLAIEREIKTLKDMERINAARIKRRDEWKKKVEDQKPTEEELLWDYNKMYDF